MRIFTEAAAGAQASGEEHSADEIAQLRTNLAAIKSIIAVASAKGGTGKSSIVTNLAAALALEGLKIAILDADLNSPSIATMLGLRMPRRLSSIEQIEPTAGPLGLRIAAANLIAGGEPPPLTFLEDEPAAPASSNGVGPVEVSYSAALRRLLTQTHFGTLDLMLVDLAPGLDRLFQLFRIIPVNGAILVTLPSESSARATGVALEMASKCSTRVIGLIENMAGFNCDGCHSVRPLMPHGDIAALARSAAVPVLGRLPFDPRLAECCDRGVIFIREYADTPLAHQLGAIAHAIGAEPALRAAGGLPPA